MLLGQAGLQALRRVPTRFLGVFMSLNPVFAALTGLAVLGQSRKVVDWLAMACVIRTVNGTAATTRRTEARSAH